MNSIYGVEVVYYKINVPFGINIFDINTKITLSLNVNYIISIRSYRITSPHDVDAMRETRIGCEAV